jgi:FkbM family methyltransferase
LLNDAIKLAFRRCGFELRRFAPASSYVAQLRSMLSWHRINLVFDVGANVGQWGRELRSQVGYAGRIVSFEPMCAAHARLERAAHDDPLWQVAPRAAIGAQEGLVTLNVAANSQSSSLLPMLAAHVDAAPGSEYAATEEVRIAQLDALAMQYLQPDSTVFLKIDTQGYEKQVLHGAARTLARVQGVQLELSLVPLYEGQALLPELTSLVQDSGFELWALTPAFADPRSGRLLQVDATFFRRQG